jgi:broad specificity phosphatase PhoE
MSWSPGTQSTRVVIVRHGEAQSYVDGVIGGHRGCRGLSALGRRQVMALRDRLAATGELGPVAALYSSVLPRAVETAEILAGAFGDRGDGDGGGVVAVSQSCSLCEVHPGDELDGMLVSDFRSAHGSAEPVSPFDRWGPGAESWAEFVVRVGAGLLELARAHAGSTVVVAAHGGVVDASFRVFGDVPIQRRMTHFTSNASLTEWVDVDGEWLLARYNDASHVAGLA